MGAEFPAPATRNNKTMKTTPRPQGITRRDAPTLRKNTLGSPSRATRVLRTELTRGSSQFDIHPPRVWLDVLDLEDYRELDPVCGLNPAGVILNALSSRLRNCRVGEVPKRLDVCLIRRKDGQAVAADFSLRHVRAAGGSRWQLRLIAERPVAFSRFCPFPVGETLPKIGSGRRARMRVTAQVD